MAEHDSERTLGHQRASIRERLGVVHDPERVRALVEQAIRGAVETKDNPADLINVALEELVRARCELPGYSTLDRAAARTRAEVNGALHARIAARMSDKLRNSAQVRSENSC